jgi:hypothetical protein
VNAGHVSFNQKGEIDIVAFFRNGPFLGQVPLDFPIDKNLLLRELRIRKAVLYVKVISMGNFITRKK